MNKIAKGNGGGFFILIIILLVIGGGYLYMTNKFGFKDKTNNVKDSVVNFKDSIGNTPSVNDEYIPVPDNSWCLQQDIPVDDKETSPTRITILGFDNVENCCVKSYQGFDSCLNTTVNTQICYSSNLGGSIKYVKINDKYKTPLYYEEYITNIDKFYNKNFNEDLMCDMTIY